MNSRDFCFWLQGFYEIRGGTGGFSSEQAETIKKHLALVFAHEIDPEMGPEKHQTKLNNIHNPPKMRC